MKITKKKLFLFLFFIIAIVGFNYFYQSISKLDVLSLEKKTTENQLFYPYKNINYQFRNDTLGNLKQYGNLEDILRRRELVVCALKRDYNQFFQMGIKNGYIGEDVRLASELGVALGVKVIYKMIYESNDDVVDAVSRGEGDIGLAKLSYTPERARKVLYSSPYFISRKVVLINRVVTINTANDSLEKILNNQNSKISVMKDTSYESFAKFLFPKAQILPETDWENGAIAKLEKGGAIAVVRDELRVKTLLGDKPSLFLNFMPVILKGEKDSMAVVANMKASALVSFINKFLDLNYKQLTVSDLIKKYEGYIK